MHSLHLRHTAPVPQSLTAFLLTVVLPLAIPGILLAASPAKVVYADRTTVRPVIDGLLTDSCWKSATPVADFMQFDPVEGALPTERTTVRLLYDDHALYVGVYCEDTQPRLIVRQLSRRDRTTEADRFSVMIDSYMDRQTAFVFVTNVSGVQSDGVLSQGGSVYDNTWDAVWRVRTRIGPGGWTAEFAIPWDALRFAKGSYDWGINFRRYISRKKELTEWTMVPRSERFPIPRWGTVRGIRAIVPPLHLEIVPFLSATKTSTTGRIGRPIPVSTSFEAGIDVKYGLARNFTIDATINPDFGQVEVDQAVLNLTVFETRFPEKRPFFLEAAQMFTFGSSTDNTPLTLFFSRRIGRRPGGSDAVLVPDGGRVVENPQVTTILGAAKVTGRTASGLSIAALGAMTDEEQARVWSPSGETTTRTEPRAAYQVLRMKQEFEGGSWVGGIATLAARRGLTPAMTGGLDWNVRVDGSRSTLDGYVAAARAPGPAGTLDGMAGRLLFSRISAEHWFPTISYDFYTRHFAPGDLGFFAQPHDHGGYVQVLYRENASGGPFLRYYMAVNPEYRWNWNGTLTHALLRAQCDVELRNFWRTELIYVRRLRAYDDEERGILGLYRRPGAHQISAQVFSDDRHDVAASFFGEVEFDDLHKTSLRAGTDLTFRFTPWVELNPSVWYQHTRREEAWVYPSGNITDPALAQEPFSVFGDRRIESLDLSLRGTVTFSRTLSVQCFAQVLLARGQYAGFRRLVGPEILVPYDYSANPQFTNPDFNSVVMNANLLLRWEYLPGSTLYLVWTQARIGDTGDYATGFGRRLGDVGRLPREDAFVIKGVYWFGL